MVAATVPRMAAFTRRDILAQLDAHCGTFTFPMLDNGYVYLVDTRLTAFRDDRRWALVIETLGYSPRAGQLDNTVHRYGNCIDGKTGTHNSDFLCAIAGDIEDPDNGEHLLPGLDAISIRGVTIAVPRRDEPWPLADFFRTLVPAHRDLLLADRGELMMRLPPDLPQILRLEEWHHPNVVAEELPSASPTFQMIAEVMVSGDPRKYAPKMAANTHWSHWPDGGSL